MGRWVATAAAAATLTVVVSCTEPRGGDVDKKVLDIERRLVKIDELLASGNPGVAGQKTPQKRAPAPDPSTVYAIPIDGAPFTGGADAVVTIVEGFEFA